MFENSAKIADPKRAMFFDMVQRSNLVLYLFCETSTEPPIRAKLPVKLDAVKCAWESRPIAIPPPSQASLFTMCVSSIISVVPSDSEMAPPSLPASFARITVLVIVTCERSARMAPPSYVAELPSKVDKEMIEGSESSSTMAGPELAVHSLNMELVRSS